MRGACLDPAQRPEPTENAWLASPSPSRRERTRTRRRPCQYHSKERAVRGERPRKDRLAAYSDAVFRRDRYRHGARTQGARTANVLGTLAAAGPHPSSATTDSPGPFRRLRVVVVTGTALQGRFGLPDASQEREHRVGRSRPALARTISPAPRSSPHRREGLVPSRRAPTRDRGRRRRCPRFHPRDRTATWVRRRGPQPHASACR
jgi:hypothetical protein